MSDLAARAKANSQAFLAAVSTAFRDSLLADTESTGQSEEQQEAEPSDVAQHPTCMMALTG